MAGLIQQQMAPEEAEAAPDADNGNPAGGQDITADSVRENLQLPEGLKPAYDKVVAAGLKVMFDPSTRQATAQFMEGPGEPAEKLANGVAGVMLLLFQESNKTMPPQVIIPAGIELLVHASEVAKSSGMQMDNNDVAEGIADMVGILLKKFGVDPEQMQGMMTQMTGGTDAPGEAPDEAQPQPEGAM